MIPFFSSKWLPEEKGDWTEVTDYRLHAADASTTPGYYCVRISWNGAHIHQAVSYTHLTLPTILRV